MMMPANFTAVNSEVVYGGGVLETIGAYTADVWTAKNFKQFNTNILTILSNSFTGDLVKGTLGTMFGGEWDKDHKMFDKESGSFSSLYYKNGEKMNFLNGMMQTIGYAASIYTLGTTEAKNAIKEGILTTDGAFVF